MTKMRKFSMQKALTVTDHHTGAFLVWDEQLTTVHAQGLLKTKAAIIYTLNPKDWFCFFLLLSRDMNKLFLSSVGICTRAKTNGALILKSLPAAGCFQIFIRIFWWWCTAGSMLATPGSPRKIPDCQVALCEIKTFEMADFKLQNVTEHGIGKRHAPLALQGDSSI